MKRHRNKRSSIACRHDHKIGIFLSKISQGAVALVAAAKRTYASSPVHAIPFKAVKSLQKLSHKIRGLWAPDGKALQRLRDRVSTGWDRISSHVKSYGTKISDASSALTGGTRAFRSRLNASVRRSGATVRKALSKARGTALRIVGNLAEKLARIGEKTGRPFPAWPSQKDRDRAGDVERVFKARSYPGSRDRQYVIHIPAGYTGKKAVPLVMVLHGCGQSHKDIQVVSAFDAVADSAGFLVVYPFLSARERYPVMGNGNCWGWWLSSEIRSGAGEVEDLWQIVEEIKTDYPVDPRRIHVTGLSAGAGMTAAMLVAHADRIASGATVAGVPYSETMRAVRFLPLIPLRYKSVPSIVSAMRAELGNEVPPLPILIVHSHNDETVGIMAARNLRDSWAQCLGIDLSVKGEFRTGSWNGTQWKHTQYGDDARSSMIETLFLKGPGHGWYGGRPGKYSYPDAPHVSELIWDFFSRHPRPAGIMTAPLRELAEQML